MLKVAQPNHLVIKPIFDSTITKDPKAAAIEVALNTMIQNFESDIATPVTVTVKFVVTKTAQEQHDCERNVRILYSSYVESAGVSTPPVRPINPRSPAFPAERPIR